MQERDSGKLAVLPQTDAGQVSKEFGRVFAPRPDRRPRLDLVSIEWNIDVPGLRLDRDGFLSGRKLERQVQLRGPLASRVSSWEYGANP